MNSEQLCVGCLAAVLFAYPGETCAQEIFFDRSTPAIRDRAVIVPPDRFTPSFIEELAHRFVRDTATQKLARLTLAVDSDGLARTLFHPDIHATYESTIADIRTLRLPDVPVARVFVFNGSALLSYRDKQGYSERMIAGTVNPLLLREHQTQFEILHFTLTPPGPALSPSAYSLAVYLKASPNVSISACEAVTKTLWNLTKSSVFLLRVEVRPDVYFLTNLDFPVIFPFRADLGLPGKAEFELAPHAVCGLTQRHQEVRCYARENPRKPRGHKL